MKQKLFLHFITVWVVFLTSVAAFAQKNKKPVDLSKKIKEIALIIQGEVSLGTETMEGVVLELKKGETTIQSVTTKRNGKYKFKLELSTDVPGNSYMIIISKQGYVTKKLSVNTLLPKQDLAEVGDDFEHELSITMMVQKDKDVVLQNPSAKITWNKPKRNFEMDQKYARIVQKEEKLFAENPKKYKQMIDDQKKKKEEEEKNKLSAADKLKSDAEKKIKEESEKKRLKEEEEKKKAEEALKKSLSKIKEQQQLIKDQKKKEEPVTAGKVVYAIQLASVKTPKPGAPDKKFPKLSGFAIKKWKMKDGGVKYLVGETTDRDKAYQMKEEIIKKGIEGAFVIKIPVDAVYLSGDKKQEEPVSAIAGVDTVKKEEVKVAPVITKPVSMDKATALMRVDYESVNFMRQNFVEQTANAKMMRALEKKKQDNMGTKYETRNPITSLYDVVDRYHAVEKKKSYTR